MKRILFLLLAAMLLQGCGANVAASAQREAAMATPLMETPAATAREVAAIPDSTAAATIAPRRPMAALTFDDGPTKYTSQVLDLLARYGARGTFFVIGSKLSDDTRPILQRMVDLGCDIGMHDLNHSDLSKLTAAANTKRIERMRRLISAQIEGGYDARLLRPPYGAVNDAVRRACKNGQVACVRWSVDTRDWSSKDPKAILRIVQRETRDGAILLFHDRLPSTVTALEAVIPWLQEQGYELVTVTELLTSGGRSLRYGEEYRRRPDD